MDAGGDFVVAWYGYGQDGSALGLYAQRYNASGVRQGGEFRVNTSTTGVQADPRVAMDADGDFVVAWTSSFGQDGSYDGVYAQRYNASGVRQGGEFRVNTFTTGAQAGPRVAMDADGDFVIAWTSVSDDQDGSDQGVYAQRYNASGVPQGGEFRVNTFTASAQAAPSVAMDADGDFVITWMSFGQDGSEAGVYAQQYNTSGVPQGGEFRVNTYTTHYQNFPSVAMDAAGDFVVIWEGYGQGDNEGVYGQRYNANGVPQGGEFRVNTYTTHYQNFPRVAMDAEGDFVVAWQSNDQDGSGYGVYGQGYSASGVAQGGEFRANTFTSNHQHFPSVAGDADGDFVIAWHSFGQDGSNSGIYARRYLDNVTYLPLLVKKGS
jgi:hypothetical protein